MKAYALFRKGRKNTLAYSSHFESPFSEENPQHALLRLQFYRPLIFENRRSIKDYLLTLHPDVAAEYETRSITIT